YELEKPVHQKTRADHGTLSVRKKHNMAYGKVPGIDLPVSRLVMGVDNQHSAPHAHVMFDDYFERGGNTFDTAYVYAGGHAEKQLGYWVRNRGVRSEIVVIGKGGHTPF